MSGKLILCTIDAHFPHFLASWATGWLRSGSLSKYTQKYTQNELYVRFSQAQVEA